MIKLENTEVIGWEAAIRGMRNPMNSWEKSDSFYCFGDVYPDDSLVRFVDAKEKCKNVCPYYDQEDCGANLSAPYVVGPNDHDLMKRLRNAGTDHRKFMRMITVYVDITAPLYWFKEFDTYKIGTVANSCSTMHKIAEKEFTVNDFSHEHIEELDGNEYNMSYMLLSKTVDALNYYRNKHLEAQVKPMKEETKRAGLVKTYWWQMIQLLPSSYNQRRTVMLNYEVLANIYRSRKNHKLDEWHVFCDWIKTLPYSELVTGEFNENAIAK